MICRMNSDQMLKELYDKRLMKNEDEIRQFEETLAMIIANEDVSIIPSLCKVLDDDTECSEVMFGLIHSIEDLYKNDIERGLALVAKSVPSSISYSKEWMEILHCRILNHSRVRSVYRKVLTNVDPLTADVIKGFLVEIKKEDPDIFSDAVDEVLKENN